MSSLRNAVQRRNHKERAQPLERSKWGLLEKHKDYSLRAKDHNKKKQRLKKLTQKAAERNEDEFYYAMMSNSTKGGAKVAKRSIAQGGGRVIELDEVKLMKTQDAAYLRTVLSATNKAMVRLQEEVTMLRRDIGSLDDVSKIVFDEDGRAVRQGPRQVIDEDDDLEGLDDALSESEAEEDITEPGSKARLAARKQRKLAILQARQKKLTSALLAVEDQRVRMNNGSGTTKTGKTYKNKSRKR